MSNVTALACQFLPSNPEGIAAIDELIFTLTLAKSMLQTIEDTEVILFADTNTGHMGVSVALIWPAEEGDLTGKMLEEQGIFINRKYLRTVAIPCLKATGSPETGYQAAEEPGGTCPTP